MKKAMISSSLMMAMFGAVACNQATAMSKAPPAPIIDDSAPIAHSPAPVPLPPAPQTGTFEQGLEVGERNGTLIVQRLKLRTVGTQGCSALAELQTALLSVTRSIRPPSQSDDALVAGFYSGYLRALRSGIREARAGCDQLTFESGEYAGSLYGTLFCQVGQINPLALDALQAQELYAGWTGGVALRLQECAAALAAATSTCALQSIEALTALACQDLIEE